MRDSFILYVKYIDQIELLSTEQRGILLTAIYYYVIGKSLPEMDGVTNMAFSFIRSQLDKDREKYDEVCRKRSEAGKAGGRPKANAFSESKEKAKKANAFSEKQTKAKKADNEYDNENDIKENTLKSVKEKRFAPPTLENVIGYCQENGYVIDAQRFIDFYESKGWMIGKNKMKDWKAAVRNWARQEARQEKTAQKQSSKNAFNNFRQRDYDYPGLQKELIKNSIGGSG